MSGSESGSASEKTNSSADAIATTVILGVVVATVSFWLAGMPS